MMELKKEIESLLFSSGKMMKEKELAELTNHSEKEVNEALQELKKEYDERDTSLMLVNSGDSWKLNVREKYMGLVTKIIADTELPFPVLETLGVIAYKAPVLQAEVIKARGTNAYEQIGVLVEAGFVEKKKEGRSFRLNLTPKFFEYFDVAGHEQIKEALKDIKVPKKVGNLKVVDIPEEEKREEEEKKKIGELEVFETTPDAEKETSPAIEPDNEFLDDIDKRINELSKKNDDLDQDDSFKMPDELGLEPGLESTKEEEGEKTAAAEEKEEAEEGDEEADESSEEEKEEASEEKDSSKEQ
jgi:segregation and condensation protein B